MSKIAESPSPPYPVAASSPDPPYPVAASSPPYPVAASSPPYPVAASSPPYPVAPASVTQVTVLAPQGIPESVPLQPPSLPTGPPQDEFGDAPVVMMCPHCRIKIVTSLTYVRGSLVYATSFFLFVSMIPWIFCGCFIPSCLRSMKDVVHTCPNCGTHLGTYQRLK